MRARSCASLGDDWGTVPESPARHREGRADRGQRERCGRRVRSSKAIALAGIWRGEAEVDIYLGLPGDDWISAVAGSQVAALGSRMTSSGPAGRALRRRWNTDVMDRTTQWPVEEPRRDYDGGQD